MAFRCGQKYDNQMKEVQNYFQKSKKLRSNFPNLASKNEKDETKLASKTEVQKHKLKVEFFFPMNRDDTKISREETEVSC